MDHTASLVVSLVAIGISALTIIRIKRAEKIGDEFSDADIRTASLAEMLGTLRPVRNLEGGVSEHGGRAGKCQDRTHDKDGF
jgi:hypothetical protein